MSSTGITIRVFLLLLASVAMGMPARQASPAPRPADPAKLFQMGQDALTHGHLDEAERDFRAVLQVDPQSGGAYANLGVVHMRRKQWNKALEMLHQAEHLMPQVPGIRLNIGLAYYRQDEFLQAIPAFASVVRDQTDNWQARYLLGQCYFFAERWSDAATTLEPLWAQESTVSIYLYMLSNAAHRAGRKELDERATAQLVKLGDRSPEYHLFLGWYDLKSGQLDSALAEFQAAGTANPQFPLLHFYQGYTHLKKQDYARARDEFLKDAAVEPDLALDYDELGDVYWLMQDDENAARSYRIALRLDPRLVNSLLGLAKIEQRREKYATALAEIDTAAKIDPARSDVHYMRGQVLLHLGRKAEAKKELEAAALANSEPGAAAQKQAGTVPSPELLAAPQ